MAEEVEPIEEVQFTFLVTKTYALTCDTDKLAEMLKFIRKEGDLTGRDYTLKMFRADLHDGILVDEHSDSVRAFLALQERDWEETDSNDPEDIESEVTA